MTCKNVPLSLIFLTATLPLVLPLPQAVPPATTDLTVSTPDSVTFCGPIAGLTIAGGTPPYTVTVLPNADSGQTPLETLAPVQAEGDVQWTDDVAQAGDVIGFGVTDSAGGSEFTGTVTVQPGTVPSCPNANAGASVAASLVTDSTSSVPPPTASSDPATTSTSDSASTSSSSSEGPPPVSHAPPPAATASQSVGPNAFAAANTVLPPRSFVSFSLGLVLGGAILSSQLVM